MLERGDPVLVVVLQLALGVGHARTLAPRKRALLERYRDKIRACAWQMVGDPNEIDDLTQEALLRLIRSLPSFRSEG